MRRLPRYGRWRRRGVALLTGLLLAIFVFVLSLSLLELVQEEKQFNLHQEYQLRAYVTAQAGIAFYKDEAEVFTLKPVATESGILPDNPQVQPVLPEGPPMLTPVVYKQQFVVTLKPDGTLISVGQVFNLQTSPSLLATRTLMAPPLSSANGSFGPDLAHVEDTSQ